MRLGDGSVARKRAWEEVVVRRCLGKFGGAGIRAVEYGREVGVEDLKWPAELWRYMGTADVATDMLRIVEKLGEDKLQYWGFVSHFSSLLSILPLYLAHI